MRPPAGTLTPMEQLLFHPQTVHVPIALALVMPFVIGGLAIAWWRGWLPRRVWAVAIALQCLLVASGSIAMRTGEAEEDRVEQVISEHVIEAHEEAAEVFVWGTVVVLAVIFGAAVLPAESTALALAAAATVGSLAVLVAGYRVGEAGGSLVYEHGAASVYVTARVDPGPTPVPGRATKTFLGGDEDDDADSDGDGD